jgi:hypothetical protein
METDVKPFVVIAVAVDFFEKNTNSANKALWKLGSQTSSTHYFKSKNTQPMLYIYHSLIRLLSSNDSTLPSVDRDANHSILNGLTAPEPRFVTKLLLILPRSVPSLGSGPPLLLPTVLL